MKPKQRSQLSATAIHEAGHAVATVLTGGHIRSIAIDGARGLTSVRHRRAPFAVEQAIDQLPALAHVKVANAINQAFRCLAGYVAECLAMDQALELDPNTTDVRDAERALIPIAPNRSDRAELMGVVAERAVAVMRRPENWRAVEACAATLAKGVVAGLAAERVIRRELPAAPVRPLHRAIN